MKLLHTSDWHLGRLLLGERRDAVFQQFLDWLLQVLKTEACDALVIAGDVFDSTIPGTGAQKLYYGFLARVKSETPCRNVVITGGNHDSPQLLNAPKALLEAFRIHVVGRLAEDVAEEVIPLYSTEGELQAVVCAVPFLREADLHALSEEDFQIDRSVRLTNAVEAHYRAVVDAALARFPAARTSIPLIATGHLFAVGGTAGRTERDLYVGSLGDVPDRIFPEAIDYLALGHLHRAQNVAHNPAHAYSGSPVALDFSESTTPHGVKLVTFEGKTPRVTTLAVPVFDRLLHLSGDVETILSQLAAALPDPTPGFLDVEHTGTLPAPELSARLEEALGDAPRLKLLRLTDRAARRASLSKQTCGVEDVQELTPEKVFDLRLARAGVTEDDPQRSALRRAHQEILQLLQTREHE